MEKSRLEMLREMVEQNPRNNLARYGLAMEYKNSGDFPAAIEAFSALLENEPSYGAAYFHGGQTLEKLGRIEEAKALYGRGVAVTGKAGDDHARAEMQAALDLLG